MNATWPAQKAAWIFNTLMEHFQRLTADARRFYGPAFGVLRSVTTKTMLALPAKGTMTPNKETEKVELQLAYPQGIVKKAIDVSCVATHLHFGSTVTMDAEAFGVLVTRREDASADDLMPHERTRLLDVLVSAKEWLGQCDDEERQFNMWIVSSDARDARARNVWLEMSKQEKAHHISLTDM